MKTYYLIDFENVNGDGLKGCDRLDDSARIVIFFTANARKLDMCDIANHGAASIDIIEIPAGKQSVDMHIGSYVGFLVGSNRPEDIDIVVVSADTDFDNVIAFWQFRRGIRVCRKKRINGPVVKPHKLATLGSGTSTAKSGSSKSSRRRSSRKKDDKSLADQATEDQTSEPELTEPAADAADAANAADVKPVEPTAVEGKKPGSNRRRRGSRKTVIAADGTAETKKSDDEVATAAKAAKTLDAAGADKAVDAAKAEGASESDAAEPHDEGGAGIVGALVRAGFADDVNDYVASKVAELHGKKGAKQSIYRAIISKFGQKRGLEIYRHIKNVI